MNIIKLVISIALILACYQSRGQQQANDKKVKKNRMFFYPSQESREALVVRPLILYPNPANHEVVISLPGITSKAGKEAFVLNVCDKRGVQLIQQKWNGEKIDVSAFPSGIYIVTLRKGQQYYSQKLVVKRE